MQRRSFFKTLLAAPAISVAAADDFSNRMKGLPPLTIKDVRVITTNGGGNYRWVFLKIITSEDGLYGIGSANDNYQTFAVATALEKHLKPWLIGKDPDRIEDLWQAANYRTYWRGGPVNNKVIAAMDEALWDIKGKRAGMPVYEMLGGRAHDAVACYDHVSGRTKEQAADAVAKSMENGFRHIRLQYGEGGYGGGGFIPANQGNRAEGGYQGQAFDDDLYVETIPPVFEYVAIESRIRAQADPRCALEAKRIQRALVLEEDGAGSHVFRGGSAASRAGCLVQGGAANLCDAAGGGRTVHQSGRVLSADRRSRHQFHPHARYRHWRNHAGEKAGQSVRGLRGEDGVPGGRRKRSR